MNALCSTAGPASTRRPARDRSRAIAEEAVLDAQEHLVASRQVHLDQLADKLGEDRARSFDGPLLSGGDERAFSARDLECVRDIGLIAREYGLGRGARTCSFSGLGAAGRPDTPSGW